MILSDAPPVPNLTPVWDWFELSYSNYLVLWRRNPETPEGKYLVKRRDGTVVEWSSFVIGAKDPAAPAALAAYAKRAEELGMNAEYVTDIRRLAFEFDIYRCSHGEGDPDRGRHRKDDPATVAEMRGGGSS